MEGQLIPGHEALIGTLKFDGKSSAGDAAMAVNAAERSSREAKAAALGAEAPGPLAQAPAGSVTQASAEPKPLTSADVDKQAKAHMAANPGVDYIASVKHVQKQGA